MKLIYVILTFVALASAELEFEEFAWTEDRNVILNELVDRVMPRISQLIVDTSLDPLKLPNTERKFWMVAPIVIPIPYKAHLSLHSGTLNYLSQLARDGNAVLTYKNKVLQAQIGATFKHLQGGYDYNLKLLILKRNGHITASADNVRVKLTVEFNTTNYKLTLKKLELETIGHFNAVLQSSKKWVTWIAKPIMKLVVPLFKKRITNAIQVKTATAIQGLFDEVNRKSPREALTYVFE